MTDKNPKIVLLISGKRKSGKDYCVDILSKNITDVVVFRIAAPIKRMYAKHHNLDFERLLDASQYKEQHRKDMVQYSERLRKSDPNVFLRATIEESNARSKSVWILSDARRLCDIQYFKTSEEFRNTRIITIRICATIETRTKRGWTFTENIDDKETECGLDSYQQWDFIINNDGSDEELIKSLEPIINLCDKS